MTGRLPTHNMTPQAIADGNWLAGLIDGEGCFYLSTTRTRTVRGSGRIYRCLGIEFKLAMRADDIAVVKRAQAMLGVGHVNIFKRAGPATHVNAKPLATLCVYSRKEIPRVIDVFRAYPLRSKKQRDFVLWAEAFEHFANAVSATALNCTSKGAIERPSAVIRRPPAGTARRRFRSIPDSVWDVIADYEKKINATRLYVDPRQ